MSMKINVKKCFILSIIMGVMCQSVLAIEDTQSKKSRFSFFKKDKNEVRLEKKKEPKRAKIT